MDKVTQGNAANAEASASAALELNSQAAALKQVADELLLLVGGRATAELPQSRVRAPGADAAPPVSGFEETVPVSVPAEENSPALIQWDEACMTTGVVEIDQQHQELIAMINRLHGACVAGAGKAELRQMLGFLAAYVQTHFRHEEEVMEQHRCPARVRNKTAHEEFLKVFRRLLATFEAKGPTTTVLIELKQLVGDWLRNHICSIDTSLRKCGPTHPRSSDRQSEKAELLDFRAP